MNLAILGTDPDGIALAKAALEAGHSVTWLGDVRPEDAADMAALLPGLAPRNDWELLLDPALADAVIVGTGTTPPDLRAEQLKRLATDARPLLVVHPASSSVLGYYEVDMLRREMHAVVRHYNPLIGAPALAELAGWVQTDDGPTGEVHQVICERHLVDCGRAAVLRTLARDAELLRMLSGGIRTVSAVGPRIDDAAFASLQVQMTTRSTTTLRWSVTPSVDGIPRVGLTLVGARGVARLKMPVDYAVTIASEVDPDWQLEISAAGEANVRSASEWNAPRHAIEQLEAALPANGTEQSDAASSWSAATSAMETVDAIELSLQKGRTIEVHQQQLTEQLAFRGTMAAFGCGLLFFGFFVLVAAGLFGDFVGNVIGVPLGAMLKSVWPWALLALLGFFLSLQTVPWLASKRQRKRGANEDGN